MMLKRQSMRRKEIQEKGLDCAEGKKSFTNPKLTFVEPKLTKQGDATKITAGFFGAFSP
ncbi:MAG: hypothetical protein SCALA701_08310 [Candidatus Scalindua sp.]|nr:hypothetical protein [Planctomycetota bacterium]GJQ58030.1 MAG: hypothetical protein SCALA701_08310 [Candidatus Scalindua sp.]